MMPALIIALPFPFNVIAGMGVGVVFVVWLAFGIARFINYMDRYRTFTKTFKAMIKNKKYLDILLIPQFLIGIALYCGGYAFRGVIEGIVKFSGDV